MMPDAPPVYRSSTAGTRRSRPSRRAMTAAFPEYVDKAVAEGWLEPDGVDRYGRPKYREVAG